MKRIYLILALLVTTAHAEEDFLRSGSTEELKKYYSVSSVTINEMTESNATDTSDSTKTNFPATPPLPNLMRASAHPSEYALVDALGELDAVLAVTKSIIAIGKEIYPIVQAGRPVVNTSFSPIAVLPKLDENKYPAFYQMEKWSAPKAKRYHAEFKNGFGMTVVSFNYTLTFQYGGSYLGHGRYLNGINITPGVLNVTWGFDFNADFKLISIANEGTMQDPVAGAQLQLNYRVKSLMSDVQSSKAFYLNGNGTLNELN